MLPYYINTMAHLGIRILIHNQLNIKSGSNPTFEKSKIPIFLGLMILSESEVNAYFLDYAVKQTCVVYARSFDIIVAF